MKYPNAEDELMKTATMEWMKEQFDGDEDNARKFVRLQIACIELWNRGFTWTDI